MKTEDKILLIEDLCCRLPFGVKCYIPEINDYRVLGSIQYDGVNTLFDFWNKEQTRYELQLYISEFKPYLLPMSSMTEEQWNNAPRAGLTKFTFESFKCGCFTLASYTCDNNLHDLIEFINWLIKNYFDVNDLIPMKLAKDATGLDIY